MRRIALAVVVGLLGCDAAPTPLEQIAGTWLFDINASETTAWTFSATGTYATQHFLFTSPNSAQDQATQGSFGADGRNLTLDPAKSTCPGPAPIEILDYTLSGSTLAVSDGVTSVLFVRSTSTGGAAVSGVLTFGCFLSDGTFAPQALLPVGH